MTGFVTPQVRKVALTLMEGLNCPRSLTVAILLRYNEMEQLVNLKCLPHLYCDPDSYLDAASATDFLRKLNSPVPGVDLEEATFQKWKWAESQCFHTNRRLYEIMDFGTLLGSPVHNVILNFIQDFRKNLEWLIGSGPDPVFDGKFGPGATMSDTSGRTTVLHKLSSTPTLTPSAIYYLVPWTGTKWAAAVAARGDDVSIVRGNAYFTVDKTAISRRSCGKEPSLNVYYQLGLGREMRRRLKDRGIDLDNGQNVHRQVACSASKSGEFCTIDLSSASDTVCRALVKLVTPHRWFNHLDALRSSHTRVKGTWWRLEKFSSMGNGFTFELETALFTALCMTCMGADGFPGRNLWVYGDDIIVPSVFYEKVKWALKFFGFTLNPEKTFHEGSFRESCGGDFFDGVAVRPYYLKENPSEPQHFIAMANGLRRLACNNGQDPTRFARLRRAWFECLDNLPVALRQCRGPSDLGDVVIHDDESRWRTRWRGNGIRYVRVYRPASFKGIAFNRFDPYVQLAGALYGVTLYPLKPRRTWPEGFDSRILVEREGVTGYKVGWMPYS